MIKNILKDKKGESIFYVPIIIIISLTALSIISNYIHVRSEVNEIENTIEEVTIGMVTNNWDTTFDSVRHNYSKSAVLSSGDNWIAFIKDEEDFKYRLLKQVKLELDLKYNYPKFIKLNNNGDILYEVVINDIKFLNNNIFATDKTFKVLVTGEVIYYLKMPLNNLIKINLELNANAKFNNLFL